MAMYNDILEKLDFDRKKYVLDGYFIRKIREDGKYEPITDVMAFVTRSIYHDYWRKRVLEDHGAVCSVCGKSLEKGDIFVLFKGGYASFLGKYGIKTIDQAIKVQKLWDTSCGDVRCGEHKAIRDKRRIEQIRNQHKPLELSEKDAKYIKDNLKVDGIEVLAHWFKISPVKLAEYCLAHKWI